MDSCCNGLPGAEPGMNEKAEICPNQFRDSETLGLNRRLFFKILRDTFLSRYTIEDALLAEKFKLWV